MVKNTELKKTLVRDLAMEIYEGEHAEARSFIGFKSPLIQEESALKYFKDINYSIDNMDEFRNAVADQTKDDMHAA